MPSKKTRMPFVAGNTYHVYNRGNNREKLFFSPANYKYFLSLYESTVNLLVDTYAYCLLPNHFHFLFRIHPNADPKDFNKMLRSWLVQYVILVNRQEVRKGALFTRPINRLMVENERYFKELIYYINTNPVKHGYSRSYRDYAYGSYHNLVSGKDKIICRDGLLWFFNNCTEEFVDFHTNMRELRIGEAFLLE